MKKYDPWFEAEGDANGYAGRIRNKDKQKYADLYIQWRFQKESDKPHIGFDGNGGPEDPVHNLKVGYMARQGVRMHVESIIRDHRVRRF